MSITKSRSADALRAAGYMQMARWWVTPDQMEMIKWMVAKNLPDIARIKAEAHGMDEIEAAWRQHEEMKK
jgi:hypothetical protein